MTEPISILRPTGEGDPQQGGWTLGTWGTSDMKSTIVPTRKGYFRNALH